jgi:hypothetical protein
MTLLHQLCLDDPDVGVLYGTCSFSCELLAECWVHCGTVDEEPPLRYMVQQTFWTLNMQSKLERELSSFGVCRLKTWCTVWIVQSKCLFKF